MRPVPLTTQRGGINRLKVKGAARADSVYDLVNAYVTQAGTILPREGTIRKAVLDATTAGLMSMGGNLHVFSSVAEKVPPGFVNDILNTGTTVAFTPPFPGVNFPAMAVPSLLHFEDGANSTNIVESGTGTQSWVATGAFEVTTQAKFGSQSLRTDGATTRYIKAAVAQNGSCDFWTNNPDWTLEFWFYPTNTSNIHVLFDAADAGLHLFRIYQQGQNVTVQNFGNAPWSSSGVTSSGNLVNLNTWNHVAVCFEPGMLRLFVNGVGFLGNTFSGSFISPKPASANFWLGGDSFGNLGVSNDTFIDDFRLEIGVALYGGNFTPPTTSLTTAPNIPYSVLSMQHFADGANSTAFTDAATGANWTPSGNAQEVATPSFYPAPNGAGAFLANTDFITQITTVNTPFDFTQDLCDFTWEAFVYPTLISAGTRTIADFSYSNGAAGTVNFSVAQSGTNCVLTNYAGGTSVTFNNAFPTANTWYHVAVVRYGTEMLLFIAGVSGGGSGTTGRLALANVAKWTVGAAVGGSTSFQGYISEMKTTRNLAIYRANFTPPSQPFLIPGNLPENVTKIWFAKPFMGFPYVVAQFSGGDIHHFWLQNNGSWSPSTMEKTGTIVLPLATPNGLAYLAVRDMPQNPLWTPETVVTAGTLLEPNTYTGYAYRAVAVAGANPHTGPSEPSWPTTIGATIQEFGDFGVTSTVSATTQSTSSTAAQPLGQTITDRYGNASTVLNTNTTTAGNASTTAAASTAVTTWAPGTNYAPGAVVRPTTSQGAVINAIPNGDFEAGNDGNWVLSNADVTIQNAGGQYQGNYCVKFALNRDTQTATMNNFGVVTPGQSVTASAYLNPNNNGADTTMWVILNWYNSADVLISQTPSTQTTANGVEGFGYRKVSVTGAAPAGAAHVRVQIKSATGTQPNPSFADLVTWNLAIPSVTSQFLFEAVQPSTAASAATEPSWPTVSGNTVIDGGVTWKAIGTSIITWQAIPIMQTGLSEPVWPTTVGTNIVDGSSFVSSDGHSTNTGMSWQVTNRMVTDPKCPQNIPTALSASHVFNGSNDICSFSAVVNPTDWTSANNAGYLPTGLNNFGDNPIAVLTLYRGNLIVMNSGGYQMWQVDPDPQNMAFLDAQPVGSIWPQAAQSVANDLLFLTEVGVRNLGTIGATANMAVGDTGQPVDPIVTAQLNAGVYLPYSLYYPGRGQYWLVFGPQVFVLTVNGRMQKTWSRYTLPDTITDGALLNGKLYLRTAGNLVWQLDVGTLVDDATAAGSFTASITGTAMAVSAFVVAPTIGQTVTGTGVAANTKITGVPQSNGTGTYTVNVSQTVASEAMTTTATGINFNGVIQWPYLDIGVLGQHKQFEGLDIVGDGQVTIQVGWREDDPTTFNDNAGFATSPNVTPPYTISAADTQPGTPIPIGPMTAPSYTIILTFGPNQAWTWEASNAYVTDNKGGGAFG